jgi:hypothetical protein
MYWIAMGGGNFILYVEKKSQRHLLRTLRGTAGPEKSSDTIRARIVGIACPFGNAKAKAMNMQLGRTEKCSI